jgi:hypothetical protein
MGEMSAVPKGHPLIVAWDAWKQTDGFANTRKWAHVEEHLEGSLWAAFMEGWLAAERAAPSDAALESDVIAVVREALEGLLANYDEERGAIDVSPDAHCPECTADTTPSSFGRKTCAFHLARAALGLATPEGQ